MASCRGESGTGCQQMIGPPLETVRSDRLTKEAGRGLH